MTLIPQQANRPPLAAQFDKCRVFEKDILLIGRHKVAKAAEYGAYLNELFERYFTEGKPYWKEWAERVDAAGLNRGVLARYQLIAAEIVRPGEQFSSIDDAYEAARAAKAERQAREQEAEAERKRAAAAEAEAKRQEEEEAAAQAEEARRETEAAAERARLEAEEAEDAAERDRLAREAREAAEAAAEADREAQEARDRAERERERAETAQAQAERAEARAEDKARRADRPARRERPKLVSEYGKIIEFLRKYPWQDILGAAESDDDVALCKALHVTHAEWWERSGGAPVAGDAAAAPASGPVPAPAGPDSTPEMAALKIYNEMAGRAGLPLAQMLSAARKSKLRQRLKECGGIEGWRVACRKIEESPHCTGDNDRGWRADFDFMLQQKSFTRLMEGSYDAKKPTGGRRPPKAVEGAMAILQDEGIT